MLPFIKNEEEKTSAKAPIKAGDTEKLYWADMYWPDWPDVRYIPVIADALSKTGDAEHLYLAGKKWAEDRFIGAIADALICNPADAD